MRGGPLASHLATGCAWPFRLVGDVHPALVHLEDVDVALAELRAAADLHVVAAGGGVGEHGVVDLHVDRRLVEVAGEALVQDLGRRLGVDVGRLLGPEITGGDGGERVVEREAEIANAGLAVRELVLGRAVELLRALVKLFGPARRQHARHVAVFDGRHRQNAADRVLRAELVLGFLGDGLELFHLGLGLEAEVDLGVFLGADRRKLTVPVTAERLFHRGFPAQGLQHADRSLRIDDLLGDVRYLFLVRAPGTASAGGGLAPTLAVRLDLDDIAVDRAVLRRFVAFGARVGTLPHHSK